MARTKNGENREKTGKNQLPDAGELHSRLECSRIPFLPPPSYGSGDEWDYEDGISDSDGEGGEEGRASCSENLSNDADDNNDSSDSDDNDDDSRTQNSGNGDSDYADNADDVDDEGGNAIKKIGKDSEDDNGSTISDISTDNDNYDDDSSVNSDGDRNLSTTEKNDVKDNFEAIVSKVLGTSTAPSSSHISATQAPISTNPPTGALLYTPNSLSEKELKQHGLTQLEIQIPGNSIGLKSTPSKRGSSSVPQTGKSKKTKKTRRGENVEEIKINPRLNMEDKTAHLDITLPDEVDIFSLVIYTSSGIRNSLLLPLSSAPFRKLVDLTTTPKRSKTREDWKRIKSKSLS